MAARARLRLTARTQRVPKLFLHLSVGLSWDGSGGAGWPARGSGLGRRNLWSVLIAYVIVIVIIDIYIIFRKNKSKTSHALTLRLQL